MLIYILIGGGIWLVLAALFVFALAVAARKSVSPVAPTVTGEPSVSPSGPAHQSSQIERPDSTQPALASGQLAGE
jgi:hypothetical protein